MNFSKASSWLILRIVNLLAGVALNQFLYILMVYRMSAKKRSRTQRRRSRRTGRTVGGNFEQQQQPPQSFSEYPQPAPAMTEQEQFFEEENPTISTSSPAPAPAPVEQQPTGFFGRITGSLKNAKSKLVNWFRGVPNQTSGGGRMRMRTRTRRSKRRSLASRSSRK